MNAPYHPIQTAADMMAMVSSRTSGAQKAGSDVGDQPGLRDDRLLAQPR